MTSALDAALIDLDGTLVDTLGDFEVALSRTMAEFGLPAVDRRFIAHTVGKGSAHLLRATLAHAGADAVLFESAWPHYQRHYRAVNGCHARIYDGAAEGLDRLRAAGMALACVTNKPAAFAVDLLERTGLAHAFAHVFGGDSFARAKPDPMPLLGACEALCSRPSHTLMVGDSTNDAIAARAAGCPVVLVSYGYNHGQPVQAAGADAVVDRIDGIDLSAFALRIG